MRTRLRRALATGAATFVLAVLALAGSSADAGTAFRFATDGGLTATGAGPATGSIEFDARISSGGRETARMDVAVAGLDATRNAQGRLPEYGVFILPTTGGEIFVGGLRVDGRGRGRLRARRVAGLLANAGSSARDFAGGTVEIRDGASVHLSGPLPAATLTGSSAWLDRRQVYGRFVAISAPKSAPGSFVVRTDESDTGGIRNRLIVRAPGLPTGASPPTYTVRIVNAAGNRVVTLGNMEREPQLGASLRLDTRRAALPGGIVRWREFDGGRIEVLRGGTIMLRGHVAPMRSVGEPIEDVGLSIARRSAPLTATPLAPDARAVLTAASRSGPRRRAQDIVLRVLDLPSAPGPYSVRTIEDTGTVRTLGTFRTKGPAGIGRLRVSTRRGGSIPGGNVVRLGGQDVEVTDAGGAIVFTGTLPRID